MSEKRKQNTIWDYLQWRGDLLMTQDGFNEDNEKWHLPPDCGWRDIACVSG